MFLLLQNSPTGNFGLSWLKARFKALEEATQAPHGAIRGRQKTVGNQLLWPFKFSLVLSSARTHTDHLFAPP
jgi:hypothetical protein